MGCISGQQVLDFIAGKLDPVALAEVEQHVDACDLCRTAVVELARGSSTSSARPSRPAPPERVGRYEVLGPVGAGAMGVVYLARDPELGRRVALKLLRPDPAAAQGEARARIQREARAMARLAHPSVVAIHDVGVHEDQVFVVMELVEGGTLREWLARKKPAWQAALRALLEAGRGLAAAHAAGLVHRDVKPDNVLVSADGRARVTDFGLARPLSRDPVEARLTAPGAVAGSPAYMAPEVAYGEPADARSDLFSFCVTAWEALYGELPFAGRTPWQIAGRVVVRPPPTGTPVPHAVCDLLQRGLSANRGDRFASMSELLDALETASLGSPSRQSLLAELKRRRVFRVLVGIGVLAAAPGVAWYFFLRGGRPPAETVRRASIAVLPFANLSGGQENEYFSDGITEEIINALGNVEGLRVVARTSAFSFKGRNVNIRQIGEELNVATVLEGSVRREGNQLRVVAQLIGAADGYHIWSKTYDRELKDVFSLEDELARAIVQSLKPKLLPEHALVRQAAVSSEAHDLYLQGRYFWNQRSKEALTKARASFERAIALEPKYALAHSGLADCYTLLIDYGGASSPEALTKARAHALEALELDDSLAEAHASMGALAGHEYDWNLAERELKRAIELRPGYATAHQWYAQFLWIKGRLPDALAQAEQARHLDPTSPIVNLVVARTYMISRDYGRAIEQGKKTLELDPTFTPARALLARAYLQTGKLAESMAVLDQEPDKVRVVRVDVLAARGDLAAAKRLLSEIEAQLGANPSPPVSLAAAHLALGDKERAYAWLERGMQERDPLLPASVRWGTVWDSVRSEPRFHALLKRASLE